MTTDLDPVARELGMLPHEDLSISPDSVHTLVQNARTTAHRRRRRRLEVFTVAAVVAVAAAGGFGIHALRAGPVRTAAPVLLDSWGARGNLQGETDLIAQAKQAWGRTPVTVPKPAGEISVLYAGDLPGIGPASARVVILRSINPDGSSEVAFVTSKFNLATNQSLAELVVRTVVDVPEHAEPRSLMSVVPALSDEHPTDLAGGLCVALVQPGITNAGCDSSMLDGHVSDSPTPPATVDGLVFQPMIAGTRAWTSWLLVDPAATRATLDVVGGDVGGPAFGTAIVSATDNQVKVRAGQHGSLTPRKGDLVLTRNHTSGGDGLLGVVTTNPDSNGEVIVDTDLTHLQTLGINVQSFMTNYSGKLSYDTKGHLMFQPDQGSTPNGVSRVVAVADAGRIIATVGAVTADPSTPPPYKMVSAAAPVTQDTEVTLVSPNQG